jgi:hypothetical protein
MAGVALCAGIAAAAPLSGLALRAEPSLDQIIERHTAWRGGPGAIEAVNAVRLKLLIQEPAFTLIATQVADRKGRARVDMEAGSEIVFREGLDEQGPWSQSRGEPMRATTPVARAALERGRLWNLYGLHELPRLGHKLVLEGEAEIAGRRFHRIRVDMADGFQMWRFVDMVTGELAVRSEKRIQNPTVNPTPIWVDSFLADYRRVDGVMFPFRVISRDHETGAIRSRTDVISVEVNPPLADSDLRRPQG